MGSPASPDPVEEGPVGDDATGVAREDAERIELGAGEGTSVPARMTSRAA